jgi:uncharacterized membrane protein YqaE (UPF0057 family)
MKLFRILLAIFLPPAAVFLTLGPSPAFLINVGLTILGWIPGSIHAVWVIQKRDERLNQGY